jgi:hypothetical protein
VEAWKAFRAQRIHGRIAEHLKREKSAELFVIKFRFRCPNNHVVDSALFGYNCGTGMKFLIHLSALFCGMTALAAQDQRAGHEFFERKVRPVLVEHCYKCHSVEADKVKGGLLLDSREALLKGGDSGPVLVPGDPDQSRLIVAVRHTDPDLQMPKEKLSDADISALEEWVKMGAPDPRTGGSRYAKKELWSLKPLSVTEPPRKSADPIDAFIGAKLEGAGLAQAPPADKNTLLRRASFDLLGLPPAPEELRLFLEDSSPNAFEKVIDRLLDSPHFGERWGRHWLDVARYGESNGRNQNLPYNNAWRYRDYVINALNNDKPFPEFVREQLAGDLIPAKDNDDLHENWTATGFLVIGPKNFGEPNREKLLMDIVDEQIDVTTRAFLGLTVSCARCHDHKFDPVPTRDYYALAGIFRSTETLSAGGPGRPNQNPVSERPLGTPEQTAAAEKYERELAEAQAKRYAARRALKTLPGGIDSKELNGIVLDNLKAELTGEWKLSTYSTNFVDSNYLHDGADRRAKGKKSARFIPDLPRDGLYEIRLAYTPRYDRSTNVPVRVTGKSTKTIYLNQQLAPPHDKAFESLGVFELTKGTNNTVEILTEGTKGFVVVDAVQFLPKDIQLAAMYMPQKSVPTEGEMMMANVSPALLEEYEYTFMDLRNRPRPDVPAAMAAREGTIQNAKIHIRGDPERLGPEVPRGFLSVIQGLKESEFDGSGRLALANWIADDRNPLTARVAVNRIWQHVFGNGLVPTPDNFGIMGEPPTHPELLDYLAAEFIENGWSTKKMIRRLMLTRAYQLSGESNAKALAIDPGNHLLWRANRKRLDAESLRDGILAVNGSLDRSVGGRIDSEQNGGRLINNVAGDLPEVNRRSLYLPVLRGALNDLFQVFDFPDPHALAGKRYVTTAPTQALFLMNSPFMANQAELWGKSLLADRAATDARRIETAFVRAFARSPSPRERDRALAFLKNYDAALATSEADHAARREKVWQGFCHAIYESTEFRFLN